MTAETGEGSKEAGKEKKSIFSKQRDIEEGEGEGEEGSKCNNAKKRKRQTYIHTDKAQ